MGCESKNEGQVPKMSQVEWAKQKYKLMNYLDKRNWSECLGVHHWEIGTGAARMQLNEAA